MADIIDIDQHRRGWNTGVDPLTGKVQVFPDLMIENWIGGSVEIKDASDLEVVRTILHEWLEAKR